jgi:hypothetical protein
MARRYVDDDEELAGIFDEELAGDDDDELAGKPKGGKPTKARYHLMAGIPPTAVPAGSTGTPVHVDFAESMAPKYMGVSTAAAALRLNGFVIGTKNMNVNNQPIPCNLFLQDSRISMLTGYTAQRGIGIDLTFSNPTNASIEAAGGFFGPTGA